MFSKPSRLSGEKVAQRVREWGRAITNTKDSIANYLTGLGTSADATLAGRPAGLEDRLSAVELEILYATDDLARLIVELPVEDAIRGGWELFDSTGTVQLKYPAHLPVEAAFRRSWCWSRLFGKGASLMVPADPLIDMSQPRIPGYDYNIANLIPLGGDELSPLEYEGDARAPGFGRACVYRLSPKSAGSVYASAAWPAAKWDRVHVDWLIIFDGAALPPEFRTQNDDSEDSVLQAVWAVIRRFIQTEQALASIVTRFETATISISGLSSALAAKDGTELITKRMALFTQSLSMLNAALIDADAGEKYERKYAQVAGLDAIWDRFAHSVAKASRLSMTRIFGMSPSGLGTDDKAGRANMRGLLAAMQLFELAPALRKLASACGVADITVDFPPLDEVSPEDKAIMDESFARMATQAIGAGFLTVEEARLMAKRRGWPINPAALPAQPGPLANPAAVAQLPATPGGGVGSIA